MENDKIKGNGIDYGFNDDKSKYTVGGGVFPVSKESGSEKRYIPVEALEKTLEFLAPEIDFSKLTDQDTIGIYGQEFNTVTDPETGEVYVPLDALGTVQDELTKLQSSRMVRGCDEGDLVYVNTGSEFVLGKVKENLPKSVTLDGALIVNHMDYQRSKEDFEKEWFPSVKKNLEEEVEGTNSDKEEYKQKVRPPTTPVSLLLFRYLTDQDITRSAEVDAVRGATKRFFSNLYPEEDDYKKAINTFHKEVTKAVAARDILDGYQIHNVESVVNLSNPPKIEEGEIYQTIESLWYLWNRNQNKRDIEIQTERYNETSLDSIADNGTNGHSDIARDLSTVDVEPDEEFKQAITQKPLNEEEGEGESEILEELEELEPIMTFKGWEPNSWMSKDENYRHIHERVTKLLKEEVSGLPKFSVLYRPKEGVTSETARKDKDSAFSLAKLLYALVQQGDEGMNTFRYVSASGKKEFIPTDNLADAMAIMGAYLRLPKYSTQHAPQDPVSDKIYGDDSSTLSTLFADHLNNKGDKIKVNWSHSKDGFESLKEGSKFTDTGEAMFRLAKMFDTERESHQEVGEQGEVAFLYDSRVRESQDPEKELLKMAEESRGNVKTLIRIDRIARLVLENPEGFRKKLEEKKLIKRKQD